MKLLQKKILCVVSILFLLFLSWHFLVNVGVMSGIVRSVYIYKIRELYKSGVVDDGVINYEITDDQMKQIGKNSDKFIIVHYGMVFYNHSIWKDIRKVKIIPTFPKKMEQFVVGFRKKNSDGLVSPIWVTPNHHRFDYKEIILKRSIIELNEFKDLLRQVKFKAVGLIKKKLNEFYYFPLGYCSCKMEYSKDFFVNIEETDK